MYTYMYVYLAETGINRFKLSWKSAFTFHPLTKLYTAEKFTIVTFSRGKNVRVGSTCINKANARKIK